MKLFDTHCHFETTSREEVLSILHRAWEAGVCALTAVGGGDALNAGARLAKACAQDLLAKGVAAPRVFVATAPDLAEDAVALGEVGLDYHYSPETRREQVARLAAALETARPKNRPVIIHTREAANDTKGLLSEIPSRGIIHCFTGTCEEARAYLDLGFFISISGIVTFKSAENVRAAARYVPDDRLLIETDAPYLAPVPMRGQANEPAFIRHTCSFLATLRGTDEETLSALTYKNALRAFALAE